MNTTDQPRTERTPVLLVVVLCSQTRQWFVGAIDFDGNATPLFQSQPGNLDFDPMQPIEEQVLFLRHRLAGAMQRGCDRLFGDNAKAVGIVMIADRSFSSPSSDLLQQLADHFQVWMSRPPITFLVADTRDNIDNVDALQPLTPSLDGQHDQALRLGLPKLVAQIHQADRWTVVSTPKRG